MARIKKQLFVSLILLLVSICVIATNVGVKQMELSSTAFSHNQMIPKKYTCDGDDVSPPLV